jgi:4-hydroxybenzoate polyprenyltransferase
VIGCFAAFIASIYPLMKRFTYFPQMVLGVAFSMGIPMAFAAELNQLPARCFLLFFIAVLWPIVYDTAYAMTDAEDDQKIGIKSTALFFHKRSAAFIAVLQGMVIFGFIILGLVEKLSWIFYLAVAIGAVMFLYQQYLLKHNKPFAVFLNNQWWGFIIWLGIAFGLSS